MKSTISGAMGEAMAPWSRGESPSAVKALGIDDFWFIGIKPPDK
jgi:hypothetical protein